MLKEKFKYHWKKEQFKAFVITSVKHPKKQLGQEAAQQLINAIEKNTEMTSILYAPEMIEYVDI